MDGVFDLKQRIGIMFYRRPIVSITIGLALGVLLTAAAQAQIRVKNGTRWDHEPTNYIIGYGIVTGLNGTGDGNGAPYTEQAILSILQREGLRIGENIKPEDVASVMVTATLDGSKRRGEVIQVTVSAIGDAESLRNGILLMTELKGHNGQIVALAQGALFTGGFSAGVGGTSISENHPTVSTVNGAMVQDVVVEVNSKDRLGLRLLNPDNVSARRIADAINLEFGAQLAVAEGAGFVALLVPEVYRGQMNEQLGRILNVHDFIARVEMVAYHPDTKARVTLNQRTGAVIVGEEVRISTVAVAKGNLSVQISSMQRVSQPQPFSDGETVVIEDVAVQVTKDSALGIGEGEAGVPRPTLAVLPESVTIAELVTGLNALGVTPQDLMDILIEIRNQGALHAELVIQ